MSLDWFRLLIYFFVDSLIGVVACVGSGHLHISVYSLMGVLACAGL